MPDRELVDALFLTFQSAVSGRYSIDRELGRGGTGVVYLAREVHLDRLVAIKLLPPERAADPILRERFLREARLAAKLSHPNIIPIHSVEDVGQFVFFVMAFVDGETLATRVRTRGPLSTSEGARVLREAAWALGHAHAQGFVHRDVKPDNILLESATGRVLVADFGIAAALGETGGVGGVAGTPEFMSPEQALGGTIDARSDIYGLGATAFYLFSGRFPFEGKTSTEILAKQVTQPAPPLASLGLSVPRRLTAIVDKCLSKNPAKRPPDAQALAEQLGTAIEQRRELPAALRAFVKRNGRLDGGGTLIGGAAILIGSVGASATFGLVAGFATLLAASTVLPFSYCVAAARRLRLMGFAHGDLKPAFELELERTREELAVDRTSTEPAGLELASRRVAQVSFGGLLITAAALIGPVIGSHHVILVPDRLLKFLGLTASTFVITSIVTLSLMQRRRDVDNEFWQRLWLGRIGRAAFGLAGRFLGGRVRQSAMTHRATELSLGMAAEQLYESLPKDVRQTLGDLPALLKRLQGDAQVLRGHYENVQNAVNDAGGGDSDAVAGLIATRDELRAKLGDAVGALETIRLSLLRLHAGSMTVAGLTTHLELAAEVSAEVSRMLAAREDVERAMDYPRLPAATPV